MITSSFDNIRISGIATTVPSRCVDIHEYDSLFGEDVVTKNIITTGVRQAYLRQNSRHHRIWLTLQPEGY